MNYIIKSEKLTVTIDGMGAELISVKGADGHEYMWDANEQYWDAHAPVLFPACGRTLDNTYTLSGKSYEMHAHGFAREYPFTVAEKSDDSVTLVLKGNEQTKKNYPFNFTLTAEYKVVNNSLFVNYTVQNNDKKVMPYMLGWHPGFVLEGDEPIGKFALKFDDKESVSWYPLQNGCFVRPYGENYSLSNSEYALNEEEIYANDTMIFTETGDHALLYSPKSAHSLDFSWSKNLPYFCIWKETESDARFICLEPWSDVPGGGDEPENFDTKKMSRLAPGKSECYSYTLKFM